MNSETIKRNIENSLRNFNKESLREDAKTLVNILGYHSEFVGNDDMDNQKLDDLKIAATETSDPCKTLCLDDWHSFFRILQVTDNEINAQITGEHRSFKSKAINDNEKSSYMFIAMHLTGNTYTRTQLTNISRFIKKWIPQPSMIIFLYGADNIVLTLAIINQRPDKRNPNKQVLEKVTLIKDIDLDHPKRPHIDIVSKLHLQSLIEDKDRNVTSFDTLHNAWEDILNTEELNIRFYSDLEKWYDWARTVCKFPDANNKVQVIRIITRLLFIWFLKEKKLIPPDIFTEKGARSYLKNFDMDTSDYYRAILQNLFFATLNTPIDERTFSQSNSENPQNSNTYLYADLLQNSDGFLKHLKQVPFVNGGLFDSLDSLKGGQDGGVRIDCFTDCENHNNELYIPTKLFFDEDDGIFPIFRHYKFTVEENTPVEQEVALDPELLGQVFENLLGVYDPETEDLVRKATGSYYTRRHVVDYMVDEALTAYFLQNVEPYDGDQKCLETRLRDDLLVYDQLGERDKPDEHLIHKDEIEPMINAIDKLEILDPAVGSGAFPMGILNKLVLILKKLDPENKRWKELQIAQAEGFTDPHSRKKALDGIEDVFSEANQYNNYSRKLYLIQKCIYGVDIQSIAVTIAKLRFFISLVTDQKSNDNRGTNYGIRPLPNLETKFVAANTLIGLNELRQPDLQLMLEDDIIKQLRNEIKGIRLKYFSENNSEIKLQYINDEKNCRDQLVEVLATKRAEWSKEKKNRISLQVAQFGEEKLKRQLREKLEGKLEEEYKTHEANLATGITAAKRIADWDPYDQNAIAEFFDPEWMFGITDGFDITIGNPPYVRADAGKKDPILRQKNKKMRQQIKDSKQYQTLFGKWDLFIPFIERSYKLLKPGGIMSLIVSDAYCHADYVKKSHEWFMEKSKILRLDFCSKVPLFGRVGVRNIICIFQQADGSNNKPKRREHAPVFGAVQLLPTDEQQNLTPRQTFFPQDTQDSDVTQFANPTITLASICYITKGMVVHADDKRARGAFGLKDVVSDVKDDIHPKPFIEGKHFKQRWLPIEQKWLEWGTERAPALFSRPTFPELYEVEEKLISIAMGASLKKMRVVYDDQKLYHNHSAWSFVSWHDLAKVRNRSIQKQTRYSDEKQKTGLPKREELEKISSRFALKYLLGVMNSTIAGDLLRANRRSNVNIYPNDWKKLPIPDVSPEQQAPIIELVDKILDAKRVNINEDMSDLEKDVDALVGDLYGLPSEKD